MKKTKIESGIWMYQTKLSVFRAERTQGGWYLYLGPQWTRVGNKVNSLKIIESVLGYKEVA